MLDRLVWALRRRTMRPRSDCAPNASLIQAHDIAQAVQQEVELQVPAVHLDVHMDPGTGAH